ncbi:MAG: 30S ribosomal protein S6 [Endomicrobium sp.]|jgi:small subunit ribosomal protein S6|nr:30S ribosomal protein S6 [Endomicrobium sp.]
MNYEITFIVSPDLPTEKVEELTAKVAKIIEDLKGTVKTIQQLGKKRFAYPINKLREGSYVYIELSGDGETVNAVESFFKFNDSVIRFLTVKVEKKKVIAKPTAKAESQVEATEVEKLQQATEVKQNEPATEQSPLT